MNPTFMHVPSSVLLCYIPLYVSGLRGMTGFGISGQKGALTMTGRRETRFSDRMLRRFASWCGVLAGWIALMVLLHGQEGHGIPGWQPVNEALRATMVAPEAALLAPLTAPTAVPDTPAPIAASASGASAAEESAAIAADDLQGRLNLNTATAAELESLPGIGPVKAQAIVEYRSRHGGFRSVEQLREVSGIGSALFERLQPLVTVPQAAP
jgi:comEA protein